MARILSQSQTLFRHSTLTFLPFKKSIIPSSFSLSFHRHRSSKPQLLEIDLADSSSSSSSSSDGSSNGEVEILAVKKIDEMIHKIVVQKSTPDWLPFIPGSSFWVPPLCPFTDLIGKLSNHMTEEESLSLSTPQGWPSSAFYVPESTSSSSSRPLKVDVEVNVPEEEKVEVLSDAQNTSRCEDEEG